MSRDVDPEVAYLVPWGLTKYGFTRFVSPTLPRKQVTLE
jgi:hypothetical protein